MTPVLYSPCRFGGTLSAVIRPLKAGALFQGLLRRRDRQCHLFHIAENTGQRENRIGHIETAVGHL